MSIARAQHCRTLLFVALAASVSFSFAQTKVTEYQVKAAYLYNFGKFVNWPDTQANRPIFNICILGQDPFGADLDGVLTNATIGGKRASPKRITDTSAAQGCQIVFISSSESGKLDRILPALDKLHALTVSDMPRFLDHNGMIQFVMDSGRVRFEVNLAAADTAGLGFSSQLLKVASSVKRSEKKGE